MDHAPVRLGDEPVEASRRAPPEVRHGSAGRSTLLLGTALVAGLTAVLVVPGYGPEAAVAVGRPSPGDIVAPRAISYTSRLRTQQAQGAAERSVSPVYGARDRDVADAQVRRVTDVLEYAGHVAANPFATAEQKHQELTAVPELARLPSRQLEILLDLARSEWLPLAQEVARLVHLAMRSVVTPAQVPVPPSDLIRSVDPTMDGRQAELVAQLASSFIAPTVRVDEQLTAAARQAASEAVEPVTVGYAAGQIIVRAGDPVQVEHVEAMAQLGLLQSPFRWGRALGVAALLCVLVGTGLGQLGLSDPGAQERVRPLALSATLVLAFALTARIAVPGHVVLAYLFPGAAVAMTASVVGGREMGLVACALLALATGLATGNNLELATYVAAGGVVGAVVLGRVERFSAFLLAGTAVGVANLAVIAGFRLAEASPDLRGASELAAVALGSGALSSGLAALFVMASGPMMGITTSVQLMELARPDHPLLRDLQLHAPGTYQHSLLLGNLAEAAADAIGADVLLVRVAAYYHDVGKASRPLFFIENQLPGQNPHDDLDPESSARLVIAHVTDGVELARSSRLPVVIIDGIREHHGTTRAEFFYRKAVDEAGGTPVDESRFRYPGPRPRSRETAILMLADAAEAAVRAASPRSAAEMAEVLERIFKARVDQGQLDDSDLTLRDIQRVREVFLSVLQSVYHPRIRYPDGIAPRADAVHRDPSVG